MGDDRNWSDRAKSLTEVRMKLRQGWRNDDAVLLQYFQSCLQNWKMYKGDRTPKQVIKLAAIYRQATQGDNEEPRPEHADSNDGLKWTEWKKLKGLPMVMAKRRFITFLSEIDPLLIDVMPDEKPPVGFPLSKKGIPICAKCNTMVGCSRPILDEAKRDMKKRLFGDEKLHHPDKFREWLVHALENQRCVWGEHKAIDSFTAKPFMSWFEKAENRGYFAYDSSPIMFMVHIPSITLYTLYTLIYPLYPHIPSSPSPLPSYSLT